MTASAAGSRLKPQRAAVEEALTAALATRLQLHQKYLQAQPAALAAAGGHTGGDFACQAWLHAMFRSVDEVRRVLGVPSRCREWLLLGFPTHMRCCWG